LRTGKPIWQGRRATSVAIDRLRRDTTVEVLIVGAGITGAMIADALTRAGRRVALVDKRGAAKGSTAASTALVQYEIDTPLTALARKIGKENAIRAWRRSRLAVESLASRLKELGVPDVARRDSLYLSGNLLNVSKLRQEQGARLAAGLGGRFLDRTALRKQFGLSHGAAILSYGNLVLDPRKTTLALLGAAASNGARLFAPLEIVNVAPRKGGVRATDQEGHTIDCEHLVFATGYEVPDGVSRRHHNITSTWAIATVRQDRKALWPGECCIWEAADPYLYIRTTSDGRVICGGGDEDITDETKRDALLARKTAMLRRKLHRLLPRLDTTPAFAWTGSFGETKTGLPIIGEIPGMRRCWAALGYGGNGTTYAAIAADIIAGALAGRPDTDAPLYCFPGHDAAD
jgi:glycine/D-amino acid oxidase-like deaminating enzyme